MLKTENGWWAASMFACSLLLGQWITDHSWEGMRFVYVGKERSPAAVRSLGDYSKMSRDTFTKAAHEQLLAGAEIYKRTDGLGVRLGHFLMRNKSGVHDFACGVKDRSGIYTRIHLTFVADGVAESGEAPKLHFDTYCRSTQDLNKLETIWLPLQKIFSNPVGSHDLPGSGDMKVTWEHIPSQWPENWSLWSMTLYSEPEPNQPNVESLELTPALVRAARQKPLAFDWKREP